MSKDQKYIYFFNWPLVLKLGEISKVVVCSNTNKKFSMVYTILLNTIYKKHERGCSSGSESAHPATLTSGYSLLYITVYTVQYSVHLTFQCSIS